ncbi:MADS box transcription factor [Phaffia rhodozyma]|uniref:MADS box transcription factor n=1 Tax=Phaffia rhodozyma TaxID=264483 RepID=A0A0F7SU27_PHARH|nr:MADS box transcription factor [Phaffia rhodozyma]
MSANPGYNVPSIPQDTVHLAIHLPAPTASSLPLATALASQIAGFVKQLLPSSWIWHRDALELNVVEDNKLQTRTNHDGRSSEDHSEKRFRLGATVRVGDSIEDEWVAVWLLREITTRWDDLVASIYDSDGDFLLIEAAHVLPNWVTPSNSENRVWISNGSLHLIPLSVFSPISTRPPKRDRRLTNADSDDEDENDGGPTADERAVGWIELNKAIEEIRAGRWRDRKVERAVWERISSYPDALRDHQHRATMYLPTPIALALARQPSLIQKAVETFYTRDPTQLRKAARMTHFPPADSTLTQVTMTRTAYAQLKGQEFFPSKAFGPEWMDALTGDVSTPDRAAEKEHRDRGVKVAVGFEILCGESKAKTKTYPGLDVSEEAGQVRLDALKRQEDFKTYLHTLEKAGWFGDGEIEGSERWKSRERDAAAGWLKLGKPVEDDSSRPTFATLFSSALLLPGPSDASELMPSEPDDSENWLEVDPAQLDTLMQERSSGRAPGTEGEGHVREEGDVDMEFLGDGSEAEGVKKLEELARKVGSFVDGQGQLEGAIFDDEMLSEDEGGADSDADDAQLERDMAADLDDLSSSDEEDKIPTLTPAQRVTRMANLVKPLDPSEWGFQNQNPPALSSEQPTATMTSSSAAPVSNAESSIPISAESRTLEDVDRQRKLREIRDEQARKLPPVKMRRPILPKDSYDGVDSDDESDDQDGINEIPGGNAGISAGLKEAMKNDAAADGVMDEIDEEEDEDLPQVLGEMEVDMGEEEEDFLKFARDALGLDERMWANILKDREQRGVFVPTSKPSKTELPKKTSTELKSASLSSKPASLSKSASKKTTTQSSSTFTSTSKAVRFEDVLPDEPPAHSTKPASSTDMPLRERRDGPKPEAPPGAIPDPSLNSFEAVMQKMDEELERRKSGKGNPSSSATAATPSSKPKVEPKNKPKPINSSTNKKQPSSPSASTASTKPSGKGAPSFDFLTASDKPPKNTPVMDSDSDRDMDDGESDFDPDDPMLAMDAELRAALLAAGDLGSDDEAEGLEGDDKIDYNLIKHFLESYKSQGGMAGPVGNLLGRLKQ